MKFKLWEIYTLCINVIPRSFQVQSTFKMQLLILSSQTLNFLQPKLVPHSAVKLFRVLLSHYMESMGDWSILKFHYNHSDKSMWGMLKFLGVKMKTNNANGKIVVDNLVWLWVSFIIFTCLLNCDFPAIHENLPNLSIHAHTTKKAYSSTCLRWSKLCRKVKCNNPFALNEKLNRSMLCRIFCKGSFSYPPPHFRHLQGVFNSIKIAGM